MAGIIHENAFQSKQIPYQTCEQNRTILTITIRVIKRFLGKERAVAAPHVIIILINKSRL